SSWRLSTQRWNCVSWCTGSRSRSASSAGCGSRAKAGSSGVRATPERTGAVSLASFASVVIVAPPCRRRGRARNYALTGAVAGGLDRARVADHEPLRVGGADVLDAHGVEAHHLRGDGVDRDLIAGREDDVLLYRLHDARAGAVAGGGAVHGREDAGVDLFLD